MNKIDYSECFDSQQLNEFSEYKIFPAEKYNVSEIKKSSPEIDATNENFYETNTNNKTEEKTNNINKDFDNTNNLNTKNTLSNTTNAPSSTTQTLTPSFSVSSVCSTGASIGGSIGSIAIATIAFIIITTVNLFANFGNFVTTVYGMDYITITIDINDFISSETKDKSLKPEDFAIEYDTGNGIKRIVMKDGIYSYLITGLVPNSKFTYSVICSNPDYSSELYTKTIHVPKFSEPTGVFDEINNYFVYYEDINIASFYYSIYLSDYDNKYNNETLYVSYLEENDASNMQNVIYSTNELNEQFFFSGMIEKIFEEKIYLYIVGENENEEKVFLFSHSMNTNLINEIEAPIEIAS